MLIREHSIIIQEADQDDQDPKKNGKGKEEKQGTHTILLIFVTEMHT